MASVLKRFLEGFFIYRSQQLKKQQSNRYYIYIHPDLIVHESFLRYGKS